MVYAINYLLWFFLMLISLVYLLCLCNRLIWQYLIILQAFLSSYEINNPSIAYRVVTASNSMFGINSALLFNNLVDDCWRVRCYHCLICF